jgi:hypothetical protein
MKKRVEEEIERRALALCSHGWKISSGREAVSTERACLRRD